MELRGTDTRVSQGFEEGLVGCGWQGALYKCEGASWALLPALMDVSCQSSGLPSWAADGLGAGTREEWTSEAPSQVWRAGRGGPWGGRARVGGTPGAGAARAPGKGTPRDQEAAALRARPEVSGAAPGKGSR